MSLQFERPSLKAIETRYNGYHFRSRLEARWAVFFDKLDIQYEYEPEGFDLGNGLWYLPDFWLTDQEVWVEIKGEWPNEAECEKASKLAIHSGYPVYVFFGSIEIPDTGKHETGICFPPSGGSDNSYYWCECPQCRRFGVEFNGRADRLPCACKKSDHGDKGYNFDSPRLIAAYAAARSARF